MSRILVVDDNPSVGIAVEILLRKSGHEIARASSAAAAQLILEQTHIDLILMDVNMPGCDGIQAVKDIRSRVKTRFIPILLMTGSGMGIARAAQSAGAQEVLNKPGFIRDLPDIVHRYLNLPQLSGGLPNRPKLEAGMQPDGQK